MMRFAGNSRPRKWPLRARVGLALLALARVVGAQAGLAAPQEEALPAALVLVFDATADAASSCMGNAIDRALEVLRDSSSVDGFLLWGECLERRGDLLGARRVWEQAAAPEISGLR